MSAECLLCGELSCGCSLKRCRWCGSIQPAHTRKCPTTGVERQAKVLAAAHVEGVVEGRAQAVEELKVVVEVLRDLCTQARNTPHTAALDYTIADTVIAKHSKTKANLDG